MSKGLKELKEIELKWQYGVFTFIPNFETIEKALKALEIIRYKNISMECLKRAIKKEGLEWYNSLCPYQLEKLTQEEYDLLAEVIYEKSTLIK